VLRAQFSMGCLSPVGNTGECAMTVQQNAGSRTHLWWRVVQGMHARVVSDLGNSSQSSYRAWSLAPEERNMSHEKYRKSIDACEDCVVECESCATACLNESDVTMMAQCILLDRDCADVCRLAVTLMSRDSRFARDFSVLCAVVCDACANECERHSAEHCRRCTAACRKSAEELRRIAAV
jgi:hypothetical protein